MSITKTIWMLWSASGDKPTQSSAYRLSQAGLNVVTIPRSAENDVPPFTDKCIGFDSAREIATQAIDRLHTNASATHRIMIVELIGNTSGWLTLGAGLASGADVVLIPEIPYNFEVIIEAIENRKKAGRNFSLVTVAEKARPRELVDFMEMAARKRAALLKKESEPLKESRIITQLKHFCWQTAWKTRPIWIRISLFWGVAGSGGGTPTAADRLLATQLAEWSLKMVDGWQFWSDGLPSGWRDEQRAPGSGSWQKQAGTDGSRLAARRIQVGTCLGVGGEVLSA